MRNIDWISVLGGSLLGAFIGIALAMSVMTACKVVKLEKRIKDLEKQLIITTDIK
jgi:hypothetical protein